MANSTIKEFREFFLRNSQVSSGSKPDQEVGYPTNYQAHDAFGNQITAINRFLKGNIPSMDVFSKLFYSITFKKNPEDKATLNDQGLGKIATDANAKSGTNDASWTTFTTPSQLPTVEGQNEVALSSNNFGSSFPTANTSNPSVTSMADVATTTRNRYKLSLTTYFWTLWNSIFNFLQKEIAYTIYRSYTNFTNDQVVSGGYGKTITVTIPAYTLKRTSDKVILYIDSIFNLATSPQADVVISQGATSQNINLGNLYAASTGTSAILQSLTLTRSGNTIIAEFASQEGIIFISALILNGNLTAGKLPDITGYDFTQDINLNLVIKSTTSSDIVVTKVELIKTSANV